MAWEKTFVGKVMKGKDGKGDYIVIDQDFQLKKGDFLKLESKAQKIAGYKEAVEAGRMSEDRAADLIDKASKSSDNVRFTIIHEKKPS